MTRALSSARARRLAFVLIIGAMLFVEVPLGRRAWTDFQLWRTVQNDPSASDAYLTFFQIDAGLMAMVIVAAVVVLGALTRRKAPNTQRAD